MGASKYYVEKDMKCNCVFSDELVVGVRVGKVIKGEEVSTPKMHSSFEWLVYINVFTETIHIH